MSGRQKSSQGFEDDVGGTEEFVMYFGIAFVMLLVSTAVYWFSRNRAPSAPHEGQGDARPQANQPNRRQAALRNRRGRRQVDDSDDEGGGGGPAAQGNAARDSDSDMDERLNDPKLGAKKRAKLEAKAEKKQQREAEERNRDDKKARQEREERERKHREEQEAEAEKRREEEEKRLREEKAQRELEEYLKMKEMFTVEGEGQEVIEEEEEGNLIEKFINHVKDKKVILFEELATQFGLKVPDAIDRLKILVEEGRLTGVMDDRGKFIYISEEELAKFAKFIKQRGRVSISDLVENSASLITLQPVTTS